MKSVFIKKSVSLLLVVIPAIGWSQVIVTNKGISMTNTQSSIYINGDYINDSIGKIANGGTIYFRENVINNGSNKLFISNAGKVVFDGKGEQYIWGNTAIDFFQLEINKSFGELVLSQSIHVKDTLLMQAGNIKLNNVEIDLGIKGILVNESDGSKIYGSPGKIKAQRFIDHPRLSENLAGLGMFISSIDHFGNVQIERGHAQQVSHGDTSIYRYFNFIPLNQTSGLIDSLKISYFTSEATDEEDLYKIYASSDDGVNWYNKGGLSDTTGNNVITTTICPPAVEKFRASLFPSDNFATCLPNDPNYLSAVFLVSTSVVDGDSVKFIQLSNPTPVNYSWNFGDGNTSEEYSPKHIFHLADPAESDQYQIIMTVSNNSCSDTRKKYVVVNPKVTTPKISTLYRGIEYFNIYPNINSGNFLLEVKTKELSDMVFCISDMQGKILDTKHFQSAHYKEELNYETLNPGMYIIRLQVGEEIRVLKLVKF